MTSWISSSHNRPHRWQSSNPPYRRLQPMHKWRYLIGHIRQPTSIALSSSGIIFGIYCLLKRQEIKDETEILQLQVFRRYGNALQNRYQTSRKESLHPWTTTGYWASTFPLTKHKLPASCKVLITQDTAACRPT